MGWSQNIYSEYFTIFNGPEHSGESQSVLIITFTLVEDRKTIVLGETETTELNDYSKIFHLYILYK